MTTRVTTDSTAVLGAFAASIPSAIPADVRRHATLSLLDSVGCGLYGSTLPWTRILRRTVQGLDSGGRGSVLGQASKLSAPHAALVNGTAIHAFELDDLHPRSIVHVGSVTVPAALAAAEHIGLDSGAVFLNAVIAGYEVMVRVGMSMGAAHLVAGWHPTATHGTIGAAVAASIVLGLDAAGISDAIGIAATQSAGLMSSQYGSMVKRFHAGRAAQSGLYAALLASNGFAGIDDVLESPYGGYCTTFSPTYDALALTAGLGRVWETSKIGFKSYSTNGSCHPTIDALLELRRAHGFGIDDVESVEIACSSATYHHVGWPYRPDSVTTAQMNLSYIVAVVLADGAAFIDQFTNERISDPELVAFTQRVTVAADPDIDRLGDQARHRTRLTVRLSDGRKFHVEKLFAHGSARDPLTDEEVQRKFDIMAAKVLSADSVERLRIQTLGIESGSVSEWAAALSGRRRRCDV